MTCHNMCKYEGLFEAVNSSTTYLWFWTLFHALVKAVNWSLDMNPN